MIIGIGDCQRKRREEGKGEEEERRQKMRGQKKRRKGFISGSNFEGGYWTL